jgi:hypothetical protein
MMKFTNVFMATMLSAGLFACGGSEEKTTEKVTQLPESPATAPPVAEAPTAPQDDNTARLVRLTLQDKYKTDLEKGFIDSFSRQFKYAEYDMNNDGKKEIFVGLTGSFFCGTGGCSPILLDSEGNIVTQFSVTDYPIIVSNSVSNGWKDLILESGGKKHLMKFNGTKYPSNPSTQAIYKMVPGDDLPRLLIWENTPTFTF